MAMADIETKLVTNSWRYFRLMLSLFDIRYIINVSMKVRKVSMHGLTGKLLLKTSIVGIWGHACQLKAGRSLRSLC